MHTRIRIRFFYRIVACAVLFLAATASAQLIDPHVTFDVQRLPEEAQTKLVGLDSTLALYLREQEWAGDDYSYDLRIDISVFFTDYTADPQEDKYKAKLIITNGHDIRLEDSRWEFGLRSNTDYRQGTFHAFKSVIEFYVWMIIGMEYDRLEKLGGRPYFDRARQIFLDASSTLYYFGWDKRIESLRDYTDDSNTTYRELVFFYDTGMYFDAQEQPAKAKDYLYYALVKLRGLTLDEQLQFLESNYEEFADALVRSDYPKGVRGLAAMDPARREFYESLVPPDSAGVK